LYIPAHFREADSSALFDFIEQHSFGLLVSSLTGEPFATHLPFLCDRKSGPHGALIGHMARANPHWQTTDREVLIVFSGPHAYISPTWYEADNVVPTWNYVAVHVYGAMRIVEEHQATVQIVRDYVSFYERSMPRPWSAAHDDAFVDKLASAVVGFRIEIARLEGKWKLSQNHSLERRSNVIAALSQQPDVNSQAIAVLMAQALPKHD
jgi:transcriptional regulator